MSKANGKGAKLEPGRGSGSARHTTKSDLVPLGFEYPRVGIGILVFKDEKVLLKRRKNTHGHGEWGGFGGHLEHMESFENCIRREIREEAGIEVANIKFLQVMNLKNYAPKHYVDLGFTAEWKSGEPTNLEPEKCDELGWFSLNALPEKLFGSTPFYLNSLKTKVYYYDV